MYNVSKNNGTSSGFDRWMEKVEEYVEKLYGLSVDDLPDAPYRDWYEDGYSPKEAANLAVRQAYNNPRLRGKTFHTNLHTSLERRKVLHLLSSLHRKAKSALHEIGLSKSKRESIKALKRYWCYMGKIDGIGSVARIERIPEARKVYSAVCRIVKDLESTHRRIESIKRDHLF